MGQTMMLITFELAFNKYSIFDAVREMLGLVIIFKYVAPNGGYKYVAPSGACSWSLICTVVQNSQHFQGGNNL